MLYLRGRIYWTEFLLRGKRIRVSTGETDRARARRAERLIKAREENRVGPRGTAGRPAGRHGLLRDLSGEHLAEIVGRGKAPGYIASIRIGWRHLLKHFGAEASATDATYDTIRDYEIARRSSGIRGQSIRRELWQLRHALESARRKGWIDRLPDFPAISTDPPHPRRRGRLVPAGVLADVLGRLGQDARERLVVASLTGLRATELQRITADWIEGERGARVIRVPAAAAKNRRERIVGCPPRAATILRDRAKRMNGEPLFPVASHRTQLARACRDVGLPDTITLRDMRTTYASEALAATGDVAAVQAALGHQDLRMTQIYQRTTVARAVATGRAVARALRTPTTDPPQSRRRIG